MKVQELIDTLRDSEDTSFTYLKLKEVCPRVTEAELNSIMDALRENSSVRAMNAQNQPHATADTLTIVIKVLKCKKIFAINLGEWFNLTRDDWQRLLDALPQTNVGFLYISEPGKCSLTEEQKAQFFTVLRANRTRFTDWYTDYQVKAIAEKVHNMWWNPKSSRYLNDTVTTTQDESGGHVTVTVPPLYRWYGWYELLRGTTLRDSSMKAAMACLVQRNLCIAASLPSELSAVLRDSEFTRERPNKVEYDIDVDAIDSKLPDVFDKVFAGDTCYVTMVVRRNRALSESFQPDHVRTRKTTRPHDALSWAARRAMRTGDFLTGVVGNGARLSDEAVMGVLEHRTPDASWAKRVQMWGIVCAAYELSLRAPFELVTGRLAYFGCVDTRILTDDECALEGESLKELGGESLLQNTQELLTNAREHVHHQIRERGASYDSIQLGYLACTSAAIVTRLYLIGLQKCGDGSSTIETRKKWACDIGAKLGRDVVTSWLCRTVTLAVSRTTLNGTSLNFQTYSPRRISSKTLVVRSQYKQYDGPVSHEALLEVVHRARGMLGLQGDDGDNGDDGDPENIYISVPVMSSGVMKPRKKINPTSVYRAFAPGMINGRYDGISQVVQRNAIMLPHEFGGVLEDGTTSEIRLQNTQKSEYRYLVWVHVPLSSFSSYMSYRKHQTQFYGSTYSTTCLTETFRLVTPVTPVKPTNCARTDIDAIQTAPEQFADIFGDTVVRAGAFDADMNHWLGFDSPEQLAQQGFGTDAATHLGGPDDRGVAMLCQFASLLEQSVGGGREGCHFLELGAGDGRVLTRMVLFAVSGATRMPRGLLVVEPNWDMRYMIALKLELLLICSMWHGVTTMLTGGCVYGALPTKLCDTSSMRADVRSAVSGSFPLAYTVPTNWSGQTILNYELNLLNHLTPLFLAVAVARDRTTDGDTRDPGPAMNPDGFRVLRALTNVAYTWNQKPSCMYLMASVAEATRQKRSRGNPASAAASCSDGPLWQQARILQVGECVEDHFSDAMYDTPEQELMEMLVRDIPAALHIYCTLDDLMLYIENQAMCIDESYRNDAKTLVNRVWATRLQMTHPPECSAGRPIDSAPIPYLACCGDDAPYAGFGHIVMENGTIYAGSVIGGKSAGYGVRIVPDATTEIGWFVDGTLHGHGCRRIRPGGMSEEGDFQNGELHGPNCKRVLAGGVIEEGEFVQGQPAQPSTKRKRPGRTRARRQVTLDASMPQHAARANELHTASIREDRRHSGARQRGMEDFVKSDDNMELEGSALQSSDRNPTCSDSGVKMTRAQKRRQNMRSSLSNASAEKKPRIRQHKSKHANETGTLKRRLRRQEDGSSDVPAAKQSQATTLSTPYTVIDGWPSMESAKAVDTWGTLGTRHRRSTRVPPEKRNDCSSVEDVNRQIRTLVGFDPGSYRRKRRSQLCGDWGTATMGDDTRRTVQYEKGIKRAVQAIRSGKGWRDGDCIHVVDIGAGRVPHLTNIAIRVLEQEGCPFKLSLVEGSEQAFKDSVDRETKTPIDGLVTWQTNRMKEPPRHMLRDELRLFHIEFCHNRRDDEEFVRQLADRLRDERNVLVIHEIFGTKASDEGCVQVFKDFEHQLGRYGVNVSDKKKFAYFPRTARTYAIPLHIQQDLIDNWKSTGAVTKIQQATHRVGGFSVENHVETAEIVEQCDNGMISRMDQPLLVEELQFPCPASFMPVGGDPTGADTRETNTANVRNFEFQHTQRIGPVESAFPVTGFGMVLVIEEDEYDPLRDQDQHWMPDIVLCPGEQELQPGKHYEFESVVRYIQDKSMGIVDISYALTIHECEDMKQVHTQTWWYENERTSRL